LSGCKAAGRNASELRYSLETKDEVADPVVRRGRSEPAMLTRRIIARGDFRGRRGGTWRKNMVAVLETSAGTLKVGETGPYKATKSD